VIAGTKLVLLYRN